jgi:hypothetical protein
MAAGIAAVEDPGRYLSYLSYLCAYRVERSNPTHVMFCFLRLEIWDCSMCKQGDSGGDKLNAQLK